MENVRKMSGKKWLLIAMLAILALVLAACGTAGQAGQAGAETPGASETLLPEMTDAVGDATTAEPGALDTAMPEATEMATAMPEATEMATAMPEATEMATAMPEATTEITATAEMTGTTTAGGEGGTVALALGETDELGQFLVDEQGMTLYLFTNDTPGTSNCYDQCATAWPPLLGSSATVSGDDLDESLVGTTTRRDGQTQITYNGWPLYYYTPDAAPGDVTGQGVGGVWFVVSPEGEQVE